jgi:hypothetical protein
VGNYLEGDFEKQFKEGRMGTMAVGRRFREITFGKA